MRSTLIGRLIAFALVLTVALTASCSAEKGVDGGESAKQALSANEFDPTIAPCDDLYGFVNARWENSTTIPNDQAGATVSTALGSETLDIQRQIAERSASNLNNLDENSNEYKIGAIYKAAMDEQAINDAGFDPIKPELARVDAIRDIPDMMSFLRDDAADAGALIFGIGSGTDYVDATKRIGQVSGGVTALPKNYYTDDAKAPIRDAYRRYLISSFELIGLDAATAAAQADQVWNLENLFVPTLLTPAEYRKPENQYKIVTVDEADALTPEIDWRAFLAAQGLERLTSFSMPQIDFFAKLGSILDEAHLEQWKAYLRLHVATRHAGWLSEPFRDNSDELNSLVSGVPEQPERWRFALGAVNGAMGGAMAQLYVAKVFDADDKNRATRLASDVVAALKTRIERVDWMSPETKARAVEKWSKLQLNVGYPDKWRGYDGLNVDPSSHFANMKAARNFNNLYDYSKIGLPIDRSEWIAAPQTINAFYNPTTNSITLPAAILQPPYFYPDADDAVNFGSIGTIIGHEATHAFDDTGSEFDGDGNHRQWWTDADRSEFDARSAMLVDQFNGYVPLPTHPDLHVNGNLTLGENIADLGGVQTAYDALQERLRSAPNEPQSNVDGYDANQRFFLAYSRIWRTKLRDESAVTTLESDTHAPSHLRVNGVMPNVHEFGEAFACPAGTAMTSPDDERVTIW